MASVTVNKRGAVSLQLAVALPSTLLLVAHARDISSKSRSRRDDAMVKKGTGVAANSMMLQDAEAIESSDISSSSSSLQAYEKRHGFEQEDLSGVGGQGIDEDLLVVDYTPARKKPPIHN